MFGKIAVRNISPEIWEGLETLAKQHDRSTEAEARYALRSWVAPLIQSNERSARCTAVSARLRDLLDHVNKAVRGNSIRPSHIAQEIGENYAELVEDWFAGLKEPSFKQLDSVASYLGGVSAWLQHGDRQMFPTESRRIPEDATKAIAWLLDTNETEKVTNLFLVRETEEAGSLVIVKQYGNWRCKTYMTNIHVSEVIGAGGEAALANLSVLLELLYKRDTGGCNVIIKSHLLSKEKFRPLYEGKVHPLTLLRESPDSPWWEDFWDIEQFRKREYWPGWKIICERIYRVVGSKSHLQEERELIRSGKHPLISSKFS